MQFYSLAGLQACDDLQSCDYNRGMMLRPLQLAMCARGCRIYNYTKGKERLATARARARINFYKVTREFLFIRRGVLSLPRAPLTLSPPASFFQKPGVEPKGIPRRGSV